ncbi:hypothetical protein N9917_00320 [Deltaproteobacteria bacterium]|nr:hypothetical protein [Deltaproteobacteria bacterium]
MSINPTALSDGLLLDLLVNSLTLYSPDIYVSDEMNHTGGAGISYVERWPAVTLGSTDLGRIDALCDHGDTSQVLWVWRVTWKPHRGRSLSYPRAVRIAYGVAAGQEAAQAAGRKAAKRLAKERRTEAKEAA